MHMIICMLMFANVRLGFAELRKSYDHIYFVTTSPRDTITINYSPENWISIQFYNADDNSVCVLLPLLSRRSNQKIIDTENTIRERND